MISKENSNPPREKTVAPAPTSERAGEGVKAAAATAAAAGVATNGRASSADDARPSYVPARRRSRRNILL